MRNLRDNGFIYYKYLIWNISFIANTSTSWHMLCWLECSLAEVPKFRLKLALSVFCNRSPLEPYCANLSKSISVITSIAEVALLNETNHKSPQWGIILMKYDQSLCPTFCWLGSLRSFQSFDISQVTSGRSFVLIGGHLHVLSASVCFAAHFNRHILALSHGILLRPTTQSVTITVVVSEYSSCVQRSVTLSC